MANFRSYIFQFISVFFSFLNVKLMLDFLGDEDYSTWLVIFSIAGLIYALDFGVGSSVRNQLARLIAKCGSPAAQARLVLTYYKLILIFVVGFCILAIGVGTLAYAAGWMQKLNTSTIVVLTFLILIDFVTRAHHPVFAGLQQPHSTNFALASTQALVFLGLYLLLIPNAGSVDDKLGAVATLVFVGSIAVNTLMLVRLNYVIPFFAVIRTASSFALRSRQGVIHLQRGLPFFLLQIEFAILGQMALYFIYANFPNELVVEMAIADKVFAPFIILATIIMYPFWSGYTLLIHRGETVRAFKLLRRQEYFSLLGLVLLIFSIMFYDRIVMLWLDRTTETFVFAFFSALKVFSIFLNSIYSYFMNGVGKLRPQLYVYSIGLLIALPIFYIGSIYQNIYVCLSVTPIVLLVSALTQRYFVFNVILAAPVERKL